MRIISQCLFEYQPCSPNENPSSKEIEYHPWGFWDSLIYLNTFLLALITLSCDWIVTSIIQFCSTPCCKIQSYHSVSQHDISLCPCSVIAFTVPQRIFFTELVVVISVQMTQLCMGFSFSVCSVGLSKGRRLTISKHTLNWQCWCLIGPLQWSQRSSVGRPEKNFSPFSPWFIIYALSLQYTVQYITK